VHRRLIPCLVLLASLCFCASSAAQAVPRVNFPLDRLSGSGVFKFQNSDYYEEWYSFGIEARSGPDGEFATGTWSMKWNPWAPGPVERGTVYCMSVTSQVAVVGLQHADGSQQLATLFLNGHYRYFYGPEQPPRGTCPPPSSTTPLPDSAIDPMYGGRFFFTDAQRPALPASAADCRSNGFARYRVGWYRLFGSEAECLAAVRAGRPLYDRVVREAVAWPGP
jgi:hypothetical protein